MSDVRDDSEPYRPAKHYGRSLYRPEFTTCGKSHANVVVTFSPENVTCGVHRRTEPPDHRGDDHMTSPFEAAERLAPVPATPDAPVDQWVRHHAATALAAWAVFHQKCRTIPSNPVPGSRPEIGYLATLGVASVHAAAALATRNDPEKLSAELYDLTPEAGALNGEYEDWAVDTLDRLGVNPADIDPRYRAGDFRTPSTAKAGPRPFECVASVHIPTTGATCSVCGADGMQHEDDHPGGDDRG